MRPMLRHCLIAVLPCATACSGGPTAPGANSFPPPTSRWVLLAGTPSTVSFSTSPNAECTTVASEEGEARPGAEPRSVTLMADDEGLVRFLATAPAGSDGTEPVTFDCRVPGAPAAVATRHVVELHASSDPASVTETTSPRPAAHGSRRVRPALTGDATRPAQAELVAAGYPPRPDPSTGPGAYAAWLRAVSQETTLTTAHMVERPERAFAGAGSVTAPAASAPATAPNWSGFAAVTQSALSVVGEWSVPYLIAYRGGLAPVQDASMWIGLDGWANNDVLQAGTELATWRVGFFTLHTTLMWMEWWPALPQVIPNFPVSPGDDVYVTVWAGDAAGNVTNGGYGWMSVQNFTTGQTTTVSMTAPIGTTFTGQSAEWIIELPGVGCINCYQWLGRYSSDPFAVTPVTMTQTTYSDGQGNQFDLQSGFPVWMYDGSSLLSSASELDPTTVQFQWVNWR
jgi:hypothetical protein